MNGMRPIFGTGIPELDPPVLPLDPMFVDKIGFKFLTVDVEFLDLDIAGLDKFDLRKTEVDKASRNWTVNLFVPRLEITGSYKMQGDFFGLELGLSQGPMTFNVTDVLIDADVDLEDNDGKLFVPHLDLQV